MNFSDEIKEKLSQFDQETSHLLRGLIARHNHEIDFFERNWLYKYEDYYKYLFCDEVIMAIRDVDERNERQYQRTKLENSFKRKLNSLKKKQQNEYESFTQKRLRDRSLIFSSDRNATILSYRSNSPLPLPFKIPNMDQLINDSNPSNQEKTGKIKKKKKVRRFHTNHDIDNNFDNNSFDDDQENTVSSLNKGKNSINHHSSNKNQTNSPHIRNHTTKSYPKGSSASFLPSRSKFIPDSSQKCHFTEKKDPNSRHKKDNQEDFDVLDVKSLDKHFKKRDQKRKEIEEERQRRFEEKFSYQINSKDVLNYRRKNITDKIILDKIQNKTKGQYGSFKLTEIDNNQSQVDSNPELFDNNQKDKKNFIIESKKIKEEEILIAPINILDSVQLASESSSDSIENKVPTNQISLEYSYESYYSEYEVEEKIYLCPANKVKKKSK